MTRIELIDYLAEKLALSHAQAELAVNSALRDSVRRQETSLCPLNPLLADNNGQQRRNRTMGSFQLKRADL